MTAAMNYRAALPEHGQFAAWRRAARIAISHRITPEQMEWGNEVSIFAAHTLPLTPGPYRISVPKAFLDLAETAIWHAGAETPALLYLALWRLDQAQGAPLSPADPLGRKLQLMAKSVRRDIHKMHAFLRFQELPGSERRGFAAWFEPEHAILEPAIGFFTRRFADMDWLIATPRLNARFEDGNLTFLPPLPTPLVPPPLADLSTDTVAQLWATYYANIFNPARVRLNAMRAEMPKKYWSNLPETRMIPAMLRDAEARVARMHQAGATPPRPGAAPVSTRYRAGMPKADALPETLAVAQRACAQCRRCNLCEQASQSVWGEGNAEARLMLVGEQPGEREDLAGRPFVGPAGGLLRETLTECSIAPTEIWLTNAVKHFKFVPRGKQRLHQNPDRHEIQQCRWWLGLELGFIRPQLVVALGASAAFALTGNATALTPRRRKIETGLHGGPVLIAGHPAHILRLPEVHARDRARQELFDDLRTAQQLLRQGRDGNGYTSLSVALVLSGSVLIWRMFDDQSRCFLKPQGAPCLSVFA
jgi:probable DNA metabolism protein